MAVNQNSGNKERAMPVLQMVIDAVVQLFVFSFFCTVCWLGHKRALEAPPETTHAPV